MSGVIVLNQGSSSLQEGPECRMQVLILVGRLQEIQLIHVSGTDFGKAEASHIRTKIGFSSILIDGCNFIVYFNGFISPVTPNLS